MKGFIEVFSKSDGMLLVNIRHINFIQDRGGGCYIYLSFITNSGSGKCIHATQTYDQVKDLIEAAV